MKAQNRKSINFSTQHTIMKSSLSKSESLRKDTLKEPKMLSIDSNIINYLKRIEGEKKNRWLGKQASIIQEAVEKQDESQDYNGLVENINIESDKKSKARKTLLYLMNILSGGKFCPEIIDYFKEQRRLKKKDNKIREEKPEINEINEINENEENEEDNKSIKLTLKHHSHVLQQQNFNYNFKKRDNKEKNDLDPQQIQGKFYLNEYDLADMRTYFDQEELEKYMNNKFAANKKAQAKQKFLFEKNLLEKKKKKKTKKNKSFNDMPKDEKKIKSKSLKSGDNKTNNKEYSKDNINEKNEEENNVIIINNDDEDTSIKKDNLIDPEKDRKKEKKKLSFTKKELKLRKGILSYTSSENKSNEEVS